MAGVNNNVLPTTVTPDPARSASAVLLTEQQQRAQQKTESLLRDLWQRKLPMVRDQIGSLRRAAATLETATLTEPLRAEAAVAAHKLAGSLGMFGYPEGTRCARALEALLDADEAVPASAFSELLQQLEAALAPR